MTKTEHGIWSDAAGGFIDSGLYTDVQIEQALADFIAQGEDADDLKALAFCEDHRDEEQPAIGCELCADEEVEDDEDEGDDEDE